MFKHLYRHFVNHQIKSTTNFKPGRYFSTKTAPETKTLQDWEYVQRISTEIKNSDINEALKYLIQSHLNNQVLNRQVYYSLQNKMEELGVSTEYHEILYKLYREYFQPNSMTLDWMKKISKSKNSPIVQLLKQDYEKLSQPYPQQKQTIAQSKPIAQNTATQNSTTSEFKFSQEKPQGSGRKSRKVPTVPSTDQYFSKSPQTIYASKKQKPPKTPIQQMQKIDLKQAIQIQTVAQIKQTIEAMLSNYGKVTLHNVELTLEDSEEFDINEDVNQMYDENKQMMEEDQLDEQEGNMDDFVLQMLSSISKIKIGKIEFQNPQIYKDIENMKQNNDKDPKK